MKIYVNGTLENTVLQATEPKNLHHTVYRLMRFGPKRL